MNEHVQAAATEPLFNPLAPEFIRDPYPSYERLRNTDPMHVTPFGAFLASRHAEVSLVLRDKRFGKDFVERTTGRGRTVVVPTRLPRLPVQQALGVVTLPLHLNWSAPGRRFNLRDRVQRARVYEIVLREGGPEDVLAYVDGALLIDLWPELVLPRDVRAAWADIVENAIAAAAGRSIQPV